MIRWQKWFPWKLFATEMFIHQQHSITGWHSGRWKWKWKWKWKLQQRTCYSFKRCCGIEIGFWLNQGPSWCASWKEKRDNKSQTVFVFPAMCLARKCILNLRNANTNLRTSFIKIILSLDEVLIMISATAILSVKNKTLWLDSICLQISTAKSINNSWNKNDGVYLLQNNIILKLKKNSL